MQIFIPQKDARGCIIPNFIFYHKDLSNGAKMLFTLLCSYARDKNFCYPAKSTLADKLNCSINTLKSWLGQLISLNFVKIEQTEKGDRFYLYSPVEVENIKKFNPLSSKIDNELSKIDSEVNNNNFNNKINPLYPPKEENSFEEDKKYGVGDKINHDFEKLWEIYPKKEAKESARKAWLALSCKNTLPSFEVIKHSITTFYNTNSWQREQGRFIPQLVNFLKNMRWKDIDFPKNTNNSKVNIQNLQAPIYEFSKPREENKSNFLDKIFTKVKSFFMPMNKIDECYATILFDELYSEKKIPDITENQSITLLDYLKNLK